MRLPLIGGAYKQAGLIAGAQRSVNLYPEKNPQQAQSPVPVTHYPRPGLTPLSTPPAPGPGRCLYTATNGELYAVVGQTVYHIHFEEGWTWHEVGSLRTVANTPVSMADNGTTILIVDGSDFGYTVELDPETGHGFAQIGDPNFLGGTRVDFLDGFLALNEPNSKNWYSTLSYEVVFNALYFGTKTAWPDNIQTIIALEREMWIMGKYKSEVWFNSGGIPFPFNPQPGLIVEHGCVAPYSVAKQDVQLYWLSQSPEGARMVMTNNRHVAQRISTHAIEAEFLDYPKVDDAIGMTLQIRGHAMYVLHFPTADRTWVYDKATDEWHEWAWFDKNGIQHRSRIAYCAYAYGYNVGLDWNSGALYRIDENNFTDNNDPIVCIRSMPHFLDEQDFDRITVWKVIADVETGTASGTIAQQTTGNPWSLGFSPGFGGTTIITPPLISLRTSLDRGASYGNARMMPMGAAGLYKTTPTWNRLGMGRDFVFELSWSTPMRTALNSVYIEAEKAEGDT